MKKYRIVEINPEQFSDHKSRYEIQYKAHTNPILWLLGLFPVWQATDLDWKYRTLPVPNRYDTLNEAQCRLSEIKRHDEMPRIRVAWTEPQ